MSFEFRLPDLGEGTTEAEIICWLVKEGDRVEEHQLVVEVETDKAVVELPTPRAGKVLKFHCQEGEVVAVGGVLLTIEEGGVAQERRPSFGIVGELPEAEDESGATQGKTRPSTPATDPEIRALPAVRALAKELQVDLSGLAGSGPDNAISAEDVRAAAVRSTTVGDQTKTVGPGERVPQKGIRRVIARRIKEAQQKTAFVTSMDEFDVSRLRDLKKREEAHLAERGLHLTFLPFFMKAVQHALITYPRFNARLDEERDELVLLPDCHMGIAVDTTAGLMVPVVRDVARKSILELAEELQRLSERAHQRSIDLEDLQGSTFTLTNFGSYGGLFATPIINYPNVAILGCGRIREKPWVFKGEIAVRHILPLSLTFDHRVSDGAEACRFLNHVGRYLEDPGLLFIESI